MSNKITAYKGFGQDMTCRGFKFAVGETYKHDGYIVACKSGFHACEDPLNVFQYYPPATSRYAVVEMSGETRRDGNDTKIASAQITIKAVLHLPEIIAAAIKYRFGKVKWDKGSVAEKDNEAATASGDSGAATASGRYGAATASGVGGKAKASEGSAIFLVERRNDNSGKRNEVLAVFAGIAGRDGIKPDTFYTLTDGTPVEVAE